MEGWRDGGVLLSAKKRPAAGARDAVCACAVDENWRGRFSLVV